jgi:hypothetical protein
MASELQLRTKVRAWRAHRQGLSGHPQTASPAAVLAQSGWARSVGGCGPYVTFFSRARIAREVVDCAVANLEIHELPCVRGCTYVVPAEDFALALRLAQDSGEGEMRVAKKLGVTAKEIEKLCEAVVKALEKEPLSPDGIRESVGKAARSLGPEGQKKGLSSTLPVALGRLQTAGEIRRIPLNGRLDQQRYQYARWLPNPFRDCKLEATRATVELAARFFRWIAPARIADFQAFAGIGVKAAKEVVEPLGLQPISKGSDLYLLPSDQASFDSFDPPNEPCYHLITNLDSLVLLRRDVSDLLDPKDAKSPLLPANALSVLPSPVIVDRGRIVGLWEYDTQSESIVYASFVKKDLLLKQAVAATEEYIRGQLGDARTVSLDSPKSRAPRIEALRKQAK